MKAQTKLACLFSLTIGLLIGGSTVWVKCHVNGGKLGENEVILEEIFQHANHVINPDNFSCEGFDNESISVGTVLATLYNTQSRKPHNIVEVGCFENKCSIMVSECMPWQSEECSSRYLRFDLTNEHRIDPDSFACIDVP